MHNDRVLFASSSHVSHPVLDRLTGPLVSQQGKPVDASKHDLVVVDGRHEAAAFGDDHAVTAAVQAGVPLLLLAPTAAQFASLARLIGVSPDGPRQAAFITSSPHEAERGKRFFLSTLDYDLVTDQVDAALQPREGAGEAAEAQPRRRRDGCGCGGASTSHSGESSLENFVSRIESGIGGRRPAALLEIPSGVIYFQTTWNDSRSYTDTFTDDDGDTFTNGQGTATVIYVIWGFLSQTASANSQYLVIEAAYSVNPGSLAGNDDETRGFANTYLLTGVGPASPFAAFQHIPGNGVNSWNDSITIPISYAQEFGGYGIWDYSATVNQSIDSWSVQNASSGLSQGSQWFQNSPANGTNIPNDYTDAFSTAGHVEPLPSASTGTLSTKEVNSWLTTTVQTGLVQLTGQVKWQQTVFYAESCGLFFCYWNGYASVQRWISPNFSVDFSKIKPPQ